MTIYTSDAPVPVLPKVGTFTYFFPEKEGDSPLPAEALDPNIVSFIDGLTGRELRRGQLEDSALRLATGLRSIGISRGQTTCLFAPNSLEWVIAILGFQAAGVTISPPNVTYVREELAHQYNNAGCTSIAVAESLLPAFEEARSLFKTPVPDSRVIVLSRPDAPPHPKYKTLYQLLLARGKPERFDGDAAQETIWRCYSSGTTGLPKGVNSSHYNVTTELQAANTMYTKLDPEKDKILAFLPFFHMYGLCLAVHQPLTSGVPVVVYPRFEEESVLRGIEKYRISYGMVVPPVVLMLLHSKIADKYDISSLRSVNCGAAPLSGELCDAFEQRYPHAKIVQGWGMTETTVAATLGTADQITSKALQNAVGRLLPTYELRLVDEDGKDVPRGERGEIWLRGPAITRGYHENPEANAKSFEGDWFKTGDVGTRDEQGWYRIVDRVKELIKYKGFQVAPAELEGLLLQHPDVVDAGVVGVEIESLATELPRAYVVVEAGTPVANTAERERLSQNIYDWIKARVASHKNLRGGVIIVDAIPKSPSGKILRKDLRVRAAEEVKKNPPAKL
ncbi:putative 4-coumarate--CoA ligase 1 [Vanrija pseudolonga]|uniref:4-coumarate--CoA ligase 1 n=1 Tax=Vanrija pseudolonga TaxID=143232 RepID=A0AAF0Y3T0_9TREE|nr:putative 4-coumarate--CoA ligase 1 [Vanrija pseudolonga]